MMFYSNRYMFYAKYLSDVRIYFEQTMPMAAGVGFDCYTKYSSVDDSSSEDKIANEIDNSIDKYLDAVKREQLTSFAHESGSNLYERYKNSGRPWDEFNRIQDKQYEVGSSCKIVVNDKVINLRGKPDVYGFIDDSNSNANSNANIIVDWKVNGYCSKNPLSPKKGYVWYSKTGASHKDCLLLRHNGVEVNANGLQASNEEWYVQLVMYAMMLGFGIDTIIGIDQMVCGGGQMEIAMYRGVVGKRDIDIMRQKIEYMWDKIKSGVIFDDGPNPAVTEQLDKHPDSYVMFS